MRYVRYKTIVTKIFDGILEDEEEIHNLLSELKDKEITCAMQVSTGPRHDFVRILDIKEDRVTWRILHKGVTLRKTSDISDIRTIEVSTSDDVMAQLKPNASRWSTLDTSDI